MLSVNLNVGVYGEMILQSWDVVGVAGCVGTIWRKKLVMTLLTATFKQSSCLTRRGDVTAGAHTSAGELKEICWLSFWAETVVKNKL